MAKWIDVWRRSDSGMKIHACRIKKSDVTEMYIEKYAQGKKFEMCIKANNKHYKAAPYLSGNIEQLEALMAKIERG